MGGIDLGIMMIYLAIVLGVGVWFAPRASDTDGYFLGASRVPWWAVMLSIVATETSALTVISVPGLAARGDLTFLQLALGYLVGRLVVAQWLLPGYFRGAQHTAYERLEARFGVSTRRVASLIFMTIRALGDSVRLFATAIPVALVTGWSPAISIVVVAVATLIYTWAGGIRAVIWIDVLQLLIYTIGGVVTILVLASLTGGVGEGLATAGAAGKLRVIDWRLSAVVPYTFWGGLVGGAMLSAASHGTDHLIVQRVLATGGLAPARKAMIGSGVLVVLQFGLFLLVGTMLWAAGLDTGEGSSDLIYPRFMLTGLPIGLSGLVTAGVLAAAMSTVSSSLNALASATTHDFYASLHTRGSSTEHGLLRFGRWATVGWAVLLALLALSFTSEEPVVELALSIASITYGSLLGTYVLAGLRKAGPMRGAPGSFLVQQPDVLVAIVVGVVTMTWVFLTTREPVASLAWPWYVPLGTAVTVGTGLVVGAVRRLAIDQRV